MPYLYNTAADQREMLDAIGAESIEELFDPIPDSLMLDRPLDLPPAMCEMELNAHLLQLARRQPTPGQLSCFLGGGAYDHFVPAVVDAICSRGEFYTSYTPYQAEASQGNLQAMFEFQSLIARLTGMQVANSSLYDGASAAAEAVLMALRSRPTKRRIVAPSTLHPEYREVIATYLDRLDAELVTLDCSRGIIEASALRDMIDNQTAAVLLQQPNFFGCVEDAAAVAAVAKEKRALLISVFDPISLGLLANPGQYGANIAVAEGHSLGTPLSYGGPYLGIMACDQDLVRRMPGRIVGETTDRRGKRCFVLTLQTREQHIRRDKAT
ncbi:MAG: aminomethyl-transferring glycine dehydrogenase subunit GcvPA, partial [Planctomycetota bacterium]